MLEKNRFPSLRLEDWRETRDSLHEYARILGSVRRELVPRQKHWWHVTLHVSLTGLTTTPISTGSRCLEINLNLVRQCLEAQTNDDRSTTIPLEGQSQGQLRDALIACMAGHGLDVGSSLQELAGATVRAYDAAAARRFQQALSQIDAIYKEFKGTLREETGPVQVFPHHFDLSMNWFSGRLVPDADPDDEELADEQLNFGFSTGDDGIPEPYFYVTAYPQPPGFTEASLPDRAYWHKEGFTGAVLPYERLVGSEDGKRDLLEFLAAAHGAGATLMGGD